jgi:hypothetical protein
VRRVSRTEYTIGFQVRDARTGAVVSRGDSGLPAPSRGMLLLKTQAVPNLALGPKNGVHFTPRRS